MKTNRYFSIFLLAVNIFGIICLLYFAIPYITHDITIANPNAMLPAEAWDSAGMTLTFGLIPLLTANILAFLYIRIKPKYVRFLFFVPSVICFLLVGNYWLTSLA